MRESVIAIGAIAVFFAGLAGMSYGIYAYTEDHVTVKITGKERVTTGSGESMKSEYLIFTEGETFKNVDSLWALKFSSSDLYGRLKAGQECTMRVHGFRIPFLSWYRNIVTAECTE